MTGETLTEFVVSMNLGCAKPQHRVKRVGYTIMLMAGVNSSGSLKKKN